MSMDLPANAGACTGDLSCAYLDTLSWRSPTQPLPMEWNPRTVFEQLFGDTGSTDRVARERRLRQQKSNSTWLPGSSLSSRTNSAPAIRPRSANTRMLYATWSAAFRWPSGRAMGTAGAGGLLGAPPVFEDHLALMLELQRLAFQSDLTRVISFMLSKVMQSPRPYPQIGVKPEAHHPLSHHNNIPELIEKMSKINTYHAAPFSQYSALLRKTRTAMVPCSTMSLSPTARASRTATPIPGEHSADAGGAAVRAASRAAGISNSPTRLRRRIC